MRAPLFWQEKNALGRVLAPAGAFYVALGRWRRWWVPPQTALVPVICVGNATVGGTGKTPIVRDLLARLRARGVDAHGLCRGHGGRLAGPTRVDPAHHTADDVGDEALLLAATAPTWAARNRLAGANAAAAAGAAMVVLDDGLQEPRVRKQGALLVVDAATGVGNGRVVPAGPLREPLADAAARADVIVQVGAGTVPAVERLSAPASRWRCELRPSPEAASLRGLRALVFAGIGRPEKVFETARSIGVDVAETRAFPDHHRYSEAALRALRERAGALGAALLTTTKDHVRLPVAWRSTVQVLPVDVVWADTDAVEAWLDVHRPTG